MKDQALSHCIKKHADIWEERGCREASLDEIAGYPESDFAGRAEDVRSKLLPQPGNLLLDAGAGPGALTAPLAKDFARIVAFDLAHSNLRRVCRGNRRVSCIQGSIHQLPFATGVFDRVLCYGVLHCFPSWEAAENVVKELVRVCKPEGRILIGDNEPLVNTAFSPPVEKQPVNVAEYDTEVIYLSFDQAFFEKLLRPIGYHCIFQDTWKGSGHFDVIISRRAV